MWGGGGWILGRRHSVVVAAFGAPFMSDVIVRFVVDSRPLRLNASDTRRRLAEMCLFTVRFASTTDAGCRKPGQNPLSITECFRVWDTFVMLKLWSADGRAFERPAGALE